MTTTAIIATTAIIMIVLSATLPATNIEYSRKVTVQFSCTFRPLVAIRDSLKIVGYVGYWITQTILTTFRINENYRPISLTCVASKLMERVIAKHIYAHLAENNLLSQAQHGFVRGHSAFVYQSVRVHMTSELA